MSLDNKKMAKTHEGVQLNWGWSTLRNPYNDLAFDNIHDSVFFLILDLNYDLSSPTSRGDNCSFPNTVRTIHNISPW